MEIKDIGIFLEGKASDKAKSLGLTYMGFGRWGKNGKAIAKTDKASDTLVSLAGGKKFTLASKHKHYGLEMGLHHNNKIVNKLKVNTTINNNLKLKASQAKPYPADGQSPDSGFIPYDTSSNPQTIVAAENIADSIFDKVNSTMEQKYFKPDEQHLALFDYMHKRILDRLSGKNSNYQFDVFEQSKLHDVYKLSNAEISDMNYHFYDMVATKMGASPPTSSKNSSSNSDDLGTQAIKASFDVFNGISVNYSHKPLGRNLPLGTFIAGQLKAHVQADDVVMDDNIYTFIKKVYKLNQEQRMDLYYAFNKQLAKLKGIDTWVKTPPKEVPAMKIPPVLDKKLKRHPVATLIDGFKLDGEKKVAGDSLFSYLQSNMPYGESPDVQKKLQQYGVKKTDLPKFLGIMSHVDNKAYYEDGHDPFAEWKIKKSGIKLPKVNSLLPVSDEHLTSIWGVGIRNKLLLKLGVSGQKTLLAGQRASRKFHEDSEVWSTNPTKAQRNLMKTLNTKEAKKQSEWRYKYLDKEKRDKLRNIQEDWQAGSQHDLPKPERKTRNRFLNEVMKGPPPVTLAVKGYLERGMTMKQSDAVKFLKNFKVGQNVLLPPCGFSANPGTARGFGSGGNDVSILLRLKPKNGKTYGLALPHANWGKDSINPVKKTKKLKTPSHSEYKAAMAKYHSGQMGFNEWDKIYKAFNGIKDLDYEAKDKNFYNDEGEVIRPGWAKNKVIAVNRIIDVDKYDLTSINTIRFEIVMQEMGKGTKEKLVESKGPEERESDVDKLERLKMLIKYTNGSVHKDTTDSHIDRLVNGDSNDKTDVK